MSLGAEVSVHQRSIHNDGYLPFHNGLATYICCLMIVYAAIGKSTHPLSPSALLDGGSPREASLIFSEWASPRSTHPSQAEVFL